MHNKSKHSKRGAKPTETRFTVTEDTELMEFLVAKLPHKNRNNIKTLLRDKQVWVNGKVVSQYNHPLKPQQQVEIRAIKLAPETKYAG